jgi:hypothetical protein
MLAKQIKEIYEKALNDRKERFDNDSDIQLQIAMHYKMIMEKVKENAMNCISESHIKITVNSMDVHENRYIIDSIKSLISDYGFHVSIHNESQSKVMDMLCKFNITNEVLIGIYY